MVNTSRRLLAYSVEAQVEGSTHCPTIDDCPRPAWVVNIRNQAVQYFGLAHDPPYGTGMCGPPPVGIGRPVVGWEMVVHYV